MKKILLFIFISCNQSSSPVIANKKVQEIDSTINHHEIRIVRRQEYLIPDSIIRGGLVREYLSSTDSVLLRVTDKILRDSVQFYYTAFFIDSNIALIDMRAIKHKKLIFVNRGYYDKGDLIFENIQNEEQGKPSELFDYFKITAEGWYKKMKNNI